MSIDWSWVLVLAGAVLVLVEVALGGFAGFDLVLIGSTFVIGGVVGILTRSPGLAYGTAAVLGVVYIAVGRRMVRARMGVARSHATNVDALLGKQGIVQQRVGAHEPGMVKVSDEVWRAVPVAGAGPFETGAIITVAGVDGVTLEVK